MNLFLLLSWSRLLDARVAWRYCNIAWVGGDSGALPSISLPVILEGRIATYAKNLPAGDVPIIILSYTVRNLLIRQITGVPGHCATRKRRWC